MRDDRGVRDALREVDRLGAFVTLQSWLMDIALRSLERDTNDTTSTDRAFFSVAGLFVMACVALLSGVVYFALGARVLGLLVLGFGVLVSAIFVGVMWGLARRRSIQLVIAITWLLLVFLVLGSGGTRSPIFAISLLLPAFIAILSDWRSLIFGGVSLIPFVFGIVFLERYQALPEPFITDADGSVVRGAISLLGTAFIVGILLVQKILHKRARAQETAAHEQALVADRLKARFLRNLSHELRTPMNGVQGFVTLLRHTSLDREQIELVTGVQRSAGTMMSFIDDLLDFTELSSGTARSQPTVFDPIEMTEKIFEEFRDAIDEKSLHTEVHIDGDIPRVRGDARRVRKALSIIVDNAIEFIARGSVTVRLSWADGRGHWEVIDTGPGIPEDAQELVFHSFRQLDDSTTRPHGGIGLGLAHLQTLLRVLGGDVTMDSEIGRGTRLSFDIPLPRSDDQRRPQASDASPVEQTSIAARVLVVDDNPLNLKVTSRLLQKIGCHVDCASNGQEALSKIDENKYQIVFMDCQMPVMDGYQATVLIREQYTSDALPVLALTAHALDDDRRHCFESGMNAHLTKPISERGLRAALDTFLPRRESPQCHQHTDVSTG